MKYLVLIFILAGLAVCASHRPNPNFFFANELAMKGVWQEAAYRWQLSLQTEGESASARNNLAIAYERLGKPAEAEEQYKKALALEPDNIQIKSNYEQFQKKMKGK